MQLCGIVRLGPGNLLGMKLWGGGELGITQDGSHGRWMVLPQAAMRAKPVNFSFEEAGSVGVPFITAFEGFRELGCVQPWHNVLICGANGKVGQAATQLTARSGARIFCVDYKDVPYAGYSSGPFEMLSTATQDVAA